MLSDTALPELAELEYDRTHLALQLKDISKATLPIRQGLKHIHKTSNLTDHAEVRLAIVVDQLEELFMRDYQDTDMRDFIRTLEVLARSGLVWVIATIRSDFFERIAELPELVQLSAGEDITC
jgi:phosphoglycolate phosphatase-like HAD superfamily hydrolase